jgi:hypothetical protein
LIDFPIERLTGQAELLERLSRQRVGEPWALEAIRDAAYEIERIADDDLAADYARDIRLAVTSNRMISGQLIADSPLGERIQRLVDYCELLRQGGPEELERLRPWR